MNEQTKQLARVQSKIGRSVLSFCILWKGLEFNINQLTEFVGQMCKEGNAPDSAGRILRQLRQRGYVSYKVVNRAQSRYIVMEVHTP